MSSVQREHAKQLINHEDRIKTQELTNKHEIEKLEGQIVNLEKKVSELSEHIVSLVNQERVLYASMKDAIQHFNKKIQ